MEIATYANAALDSLRQRLRRLDRSGALKTAASAAAGFLLSAASLLNHSTPLALGLLCAAPPGICAVAIAIGGCAGYWLFWGESQGTAWMAAGLLVVALVSDRPIARQQKLLLPAIGALIVSGCGVLFLLGYWDDTAIPIYLLRVLLSAAATAVFRQWRSDPQGAAGWLVSGMSTLALAQVAPVRYLGLGYLAAGFLGVRCSFPAAALAGLGLDLAQITPMSMTGVMCLSFCLRLIPRQPGWLSWAGPSVTYITVCAVTGKTDLLPLPGLVLGGLLGVSLPGNPLPSASLRKKGAVGLAQVRLEKAALTLQKMEQALLCSAEPELDRRSLLRQAADCACDACPERKGCKARHLIPGLPVEVLERPGLQNADLPPGCRKPGRLLQELRRGQEQLRRMKGDRSRQESYRTALREQCGFLGELLRSLSDELGVIHSPPVIRYRPEIGISSRSLEGTSGDNCLYFEGTGSLGYLLLCDGMGTGDGAARCSRSAVELLRDYLEAGFSAPAALRGFNSLCVLQSAGGSATADLLEMDLHSGRATLYKWGAVPSYQIVSGQLKKIGTAGAPPGLSQQSRESADRLSLGGGEVLIMLSDGAGVEGLLHPQWTAPKLSPGELATAILEQGVQRGDDATVAVVRLHALDPGTQ